ncbi:hypothetical protein KVR01_008053 [Diaporthe batatas]|uniref:uncharacterized protein n=1 Tax=Diaporthe batatas TaxID=748121 RepID=UPI001D05723F|nr:uncharacterized protein KVR01_008053 [Diaporthe batatas]KAG8162288.1 hypothetical protein KVR01_008053 [Diaporthe batatas]
MATAHSQTVSERDRLIVRPKTLAEAEATMEINWEHTVANLRTVVSIHKSGGEEKNVGYIIAWRISKPTGINPNIDPKYYLDDWYRRSSRSYNRDSWPLAACVWAFYGPGSFDGANYDQVVDEEKKDELGDYGNELISIQTIYIRFREDPEDIDSAYGGQQLAPLFLELYYRILGGKILPAWFSLSGAVTYLLIPSLHREPPVNEVWLRLQRDKGWSDEELPERVRAILDEAFKQERFGFRTYVDSATVFQNTIVSVLGRVVQPEDSISEPGDRLILPALAVA